MQRRNNYIILYIYIKEGTNEDKCYNDETKISEDWCRDEENRD